MNENLNEVLPGFQADETIANFGSNPSE